MIEIFRASGNYSELKSILRQRKQALSADILRSVEQIVEDVRQNGDQSLAAYTRRFDGVTLEPGRLRVTEEEISAALAVCDQSMRDIFKKAADNIRSFHQGQVRESQLKSENGVTLGHLIQPLRRVGLYVPGGTAVYPSTVLMSAIPAKVAGVAEVALVSPPQPDGGINPYYIAAAAEAGVDEIYKVGGAQAIAALAYGTESIPRVDKIFGPGNMYVTAAKKIVFGDVGIDMLAGPTEVLIIADQTASSKDIAADMLSQAEHDVMAAAILITDCIRLASEVAREIETQCAALPRKEIASQSIQKYGKIIITDSLEAAVEIANFIAPEHLELAVERPMMLLERVKNAGAIFLGHFSPEALGDYFAGPSHVLPTDETARFSSPLNVDDFVKKSSVVYYDLPALNRVYQDIAKFARAEGLEAHARSAESRFEN